MNATNIVIDIRQVPAGYIYCFNEGCPKREECLRWIAGQQIDSELTFAPTVLPSVLHMRRCPHYRKAEMQRMAWGFDKIFAEAYLGGNGTYSRYKRGLRLLTPAQQDYIIGLFRRRGYSEGLEFDHYAVVYDFDH